jgi:outer membrane receptor protein involved in Fe transport
MGSTPGSACAPALRPIAAVTEVDPEAALPPSSVPELLLHSPGVRVVRHSLHELALDTRGLGGSAERRLLLRIDGRDPSVPLAGTPPWAALAFVTEDLERLALERGPASARYGGGAYSGVLELTTRTARQARSEIQLAAGERHSARAWASLGVDMPAGSAAGDTHVTASGGFDRSRGFARSRETATEYPGLPREHLPLAAGGERVAALEVRLDRDFEERASLRLGAGTTTAGGTLTRSELDRQQVVDAAAPWARLELATPRARLRASWTGYRSRHQRALGLGRQLWLDSDRYAVELDSQRRLGERGRLDGGLALQGEHADSRDPRGRETWLNGEVLDSFQALWGSCHLDLGRHTRATLGVRVDRASRGEAELSPRLGLAHGFGDAHTLRLHAGRGFLRPSAEQTALAVPLQDPLDLSPLEAAYGLDLGFANVPVLGLGNPRLRSERVRSLEAGYSGRLGQRVQLELDVHRSRHRGIVSSLLPGVAAAYPRYSVPPSVPADLAALLLQTLARFLDPSVRGGLVSRPDGSPAVVQSFANAGEAVVRGVDLGVRARLTGRWQSTLAYSLLDFAPEREAPGDVLVANAPDHRVAVTLAYAGPTLRIGMGWRWQREFEWAAAGSRGMVPPVSDVELALGRRLGAAWELGVRVTNLLDQERFESFGGDVLRRRAILSVTRSVQ